MELATARRGDGVIMTAKPGENVVYIDLGSRNGMTLGLEFAVYDALGGIPEDGLAKGRIEVVSINERSSECRIVEMLSTDPIVSGDIIANPIYDRHRKLAFFVLGEFDLDGDGRYDPDGADRIKALIQNWGGDLVDTLNAQVDFVVLGGAPKSPSRPLDASPEEDRRYQAAERAHERYMTNRASVETLAVPTLTQTVFLNFLGYEGDQAVGQAAALLGS